MTEEELQELRTRVWELVWFEDKNQIKPIVNPIVKKTTYKLMSHNVNERAISYDEAQGMLMSEVFDRISRMKYETLIKTLDSKNRQEQLVSYCGRSAKEEDKKSLGVSDIEIDEDGKKKRVWHETINLDSEKGDGFYTRDTITEDMV
ncbi:hypothetical protein, partial [Leuconostoc citreum]|uniref:hypothetical protein n=1 Tax=Leuconostoc citreum TaxID=33964 RepID=UPI0011EBD6EC